MSSAPDRPPSYGPVLAGVLALGLLARAVPLWWSPLPATTDGFRYASLAAATLAGERLPLALLDADEAFTLILAAGSAVTGVPPLALAQLLAVAIGAAAPLAAVVLVRWAAAHCGLSARRTWRAATVTGVALAVEGLFVRRTGVPDEEQLTLLVVPLLALLVARATTTRRPAHLVGAVAVMVVLPAIHNLATVVALTSVTGLVVLLADRHRDSRTLLVGGALVGGFWLYFRAYYAAAAAAGVSLTYVDLLAANTGLFVGWLVLLVIGVTWFRSVSPRSRWVAGTLALAVPFALLTANLVRPVFPGTIGTPPLVAVLIAPLVVPAVLAPRGLGVIRGSAGDALLALLVGPLVLGLYVLSASLTPPFFGALMRIQTYLHVPAFALAGLAVVSIGHGSGSRVPRPGGAPLRAAALVVLLLAAGATAPAGHVDLDTGAYPSTAMESEFAAVEVAVTAGPLATDDDLRRIGALYLGGRTATPPTRRWLRGGPPPNCAMLSERSWTATGANFYPAPPETITPARYARVLATRHLVYVNTGRADPSLTLPVTARPPSPRNC